MVPVIRYHIKVQTANELKEVTILKQQTRKSGKTNTAEESRVKWQEPSEHGKGRRREGAIRIS